jgi:hypothetical protein
VAPTIATTFWGRAGAARAKRSAKEENRMTLL